MFVQCTTVHFCAGLILHVEIKQARQRNTSWFSDTEKERYIFSFKNVTHIIQIHQQIEKIHTDAWHGIGI
jgi:hypothetical protein